MALNIKGVATPLPPVQRDSPTRKAADSPEPKERVLQPSPRANRAAVKPAAKRPTIDDALSSPPRAITNRMAGDVWDLVTARANDLGVPIRVVLTDALIRALGDGLEEHREKVKETRTREQISKINNS